MKISYLSLLFLVAFQAHGAEQETLNLNNLPLNTVIILNNGLSVKKTHAMSVQYPTIVQVTNYTKDRVTLYSLSLSGKIKHQMLDPQDVRYLYPKKSHDLEEYCVTPAIFIH